MAWRNSHSILATMSFYGRNNSNRKILFHPKIYMGKSIDFRGNDSTTIRCDESTQL